MRDEEIIKYILSTYNCPYFRDPPVPDKDLEFITQYWTLCDYEDICLEEQCPIMKQQYPKFKTIPKEE